MTARTMMNQFDRAFELGGGDYERTQELVGVVVENHTETELREFLSAFRYFLNTYDLGSRLEISDLYLFQDGDREYEGYDNDLDHFEFGGIESRGFWSKAWKVTHGDQTEVEDAFQEIVLGAIEEIVKNPDITEEGPGYLLQRATWTAQNKRAKSRQTYLRKTHNIQVLSMDQEHAEQSGVNTSDGGSGKIDGYSEAIAAPMIDHDLLMAVRSVVNQMPEGRMREVADLLMLGLSKSAVAEHLGVTPAAVTYQVKKMARLFTEEEVVSL